MSATPRPWRLAPGNFIVSPTGDIVAEVPCCGANDMDLEFIVQAVNTFDEAKAAPNLSEDTLRGIVDYFGDGLEKAMLQRARKEIRAVLAKLKGGAE